jgi:hypothetical protein
MRKIRNIHHVVSRLESEDGKFLLGVRHIGGELYLSPVNYRASYVLNFAHKRFKLSHPY